MTRRAKTAAKVPAEDILALLKQMEPEVAASIWHAIYHHPESFSFSMLTSLHKLRHQLADELELTRAILNEVARKRKEAEDCIESLLEHLPSLIRDNDEHFKRVMEGVMEFLVTKLQKYRHGPQAKKDRVKKRHEAIRKAIEVGITDEARIYELMQQSYPELIRKGRGYIDAKIMMRDYRRSQRG